MYMNRFPPKRIFSIELKRKKMQLKKVPLEDLKYLYEKTQKINVSNKNKGIKNALKLIAEKVYQVFTDTKTIFLMTIIVNMLIVYLDASTIHNSAYISYYNKIILFTKNLVYSTNVLPFKHFIAKFIDKYKFVVPELQNSPIINKANITEIISKINETMVIGTRNETLIEPKVSSGNAFIDLFLYEVKEFGKDYSQYEYN